VTNPIPLKICGMKQNTKEVSELLPDYLGFIFYGKSPRDFENSAIPELPSNIKKVGVFVDADIAFAKAQTEKYNLDILQLHGSETPEYITELKAALPKEVGYWKVFGIKDEFNFAALTPYEGKVDAFLFDTKGKAKGGNGYAFDWSILKDYSSPTPFVLSGGIGLEELPEVKAILASNLPIMALDLNSKFEKEAGLKDIEKIKEFKGGL